MSNKKEEIKKICASCKNTGPCQCKKCIDKFLGCDNCNYVKVFSIEHKLKCKKYHERSEI